MSDRELVSSEYRHEPLMKIKSKKIIEDIIISLDFLVLLSSSMFAKWFWVDLYRGSTERGDIYILYAMIGVFSTVILLLSQSSYKFEILKRPFSQLKKIGISLIISVLFLSTISFFLQISSDISRGWVALWAALSLLLLSFQRAAIAVVIQRWTTLGRFRRKIAIFGAPALVDKLTSRFQTSDDSEIVHVFEEQLWSSSQESTFKTSLNRLIELGSKNRVDEIIIAMDKENEIFLQETIDTLSSLPLDINVFTGTLPQGLHVKGFQNYSGLPVVEVENRPLSDWDIVLKAIEDRVLGTLFLLLAAPIMGLIGLLIKIDSKGPVFFRQKRHGFNHKIFHVVKFRTMHVAEDGPVVRQASRGDPRVTRIGHFLRRTSLDELPQLINVVRGEMSIVGPRPHAVAHNEYYSDRLERYASRHKMKPGITGWAQVNGYRGETETEEKMKKRIEHDLFYIENWSLRFDLKIILMTPLYGFVHKNAF